MVERALYGSVALLKDYCSRCKRHAFIIDQKFQCCGEKSDIPKLQKDKRYSPGEKNRSGISGKIKRKIIKDQDGKCIYCGNDLESLYITAKGFVKKTEIHYDHFVPWIYSQNNEYGNIVASCSVCNHIKYDKYFLDLESAREYVLTRRKEKGL